MIQMLATFLTVVTISLLPVPTRDLPCVGLCDMLGGFHEHGSLLQSSQYGFHEVEAREEGWDVADPIVSAPDAIEAGSTEEGRENAAKICLFEVGADYVHSATSPPRPAVSAHGWWKNHDCSSDLAVVTVQIQVETYKGNWVDLGEAKAETVKSSSGGRGDRVTVHIVCPSQRPTLYRSVVDVDVVGILDPPDKKYTKPQQVNCGP